MKKTLNLILTIILVVGLVTTQSLTVFAEDVTAGSPEGETAYQEGTADIQGNNDIADPAETEDPTDPGTDPTDPGTDPTDPGTDPTDPGTDPTDPGTDPTEPDPVAVESISLDQTQVSIYVGDTVTLTAEVLPENADDPTVTWTSDNEAVATVSEGVVTGVGKGTTTITAKAGEQTAACEVTVKNYVDISKAKVTLSHGVYKYNGEYKKPTVTLTDSKGKTIAKENYTIKYSNNKGSGTAKVTITGKSANGYTGTITKEFYIIGAVINLSCTKRNLSSISMKWKEYVRVPVEGYRVYMYNSETKAYKWIKTIRGVDETTYTKKYLKGKSAYKFCVAAFATDSYTGKTVVGPTSTAKTMYTLPPKPGSEAITTIKAVKPYVKVVWNNLGEDTATGYQIQYSKNSNFSDSKTKTISSATASSSKIYGLTDGTKYYFRVRAVNTYHGKSAYGNWSSSKTAVANSTGWVTRSGKKYYYINGLKFKGSRKIDGEPYYFDNDTGELHGSSYAVWELAKEKTSKTEYLIGVSVGNKRLTLFKKVNGEWVFKDQWKITTGINRNKHPDGQYTPRGVYSVHEDKNLGYMQDTPPTYTVWYCTNWCGKVFFHSILYKPQSKEAIVDGRLGVAASHGCVRMEISKALWIYENCKDGTRVVSAD